MSYPNDYISARVSAGCPNCHQIPEVTRNAMGDAVLVCDNCSWRSEPIDCGFGGAMADSLARRYHTAAARAAQEGRQADADNLTMLAYVYAGLRRAVY